MKKISLFIKENLDEFGLIAHQDRHKPRTS